MSGKAGHDYMTHDPNGGDQMGGNRLEMLLNLILLPIYLIAKLFGLAD